MSNIYLKSFFLQNNGISTNARQVSFVSQKATYMLILGFTTEKRGNNRIIVMQKYTMFSQL